tara:strand:+ start:195 stop:302 length:108 start_codon:yes stop_codon:yes gene_type:complete
MDNHQAIGDRVRLAALYYKKMSVVAGWRMEIPDER